MLETDVKCTVCKKSIFIDVYETDSETGVPTEAGYHINCGSKPLNICPLDYEELIKYYQQTDNWIKANQHLFNKSEQ